MTSDWIKRSGIVLRNSTSKESDGVITCLSKEGFFSFYAHGVKKITSKSAMSLQPLSSCEFSLSIDSKGNATLKEASLLEILLPSENLDAFSIDNLLIELSLRFLQEDEAAEAFPWVLRAFQAIKKGGDPYCAGLICFAHLLVIGGIGLDVDECVCCGARNKIETIDLDTGGFVCPSCFQNETMGKVSREILKIYRYIFKAPLTDYGRVNLGWEACRPIYLSLGHYLEKNTGVKLRTLDLLSKI